MAKKEMDIPRRCIVHGFAMACAEMIRLHGEDTMVRDVLLGSGIDANMLKEAGVDEYDLNLLLAALRQ